MQRIFVFGCDLAGRHDQEPAALAVRLHRAEFGVWSGPTGNSYAIPYRNKYRQLLLTEVIRSYVDSFVHYAEARPDVAFQVAYFACEAGAHTDEDLARLFASAPRNCKLPGLWSRKLDKKQPARMLVFDPGAHLGEVEWRRRFERYLALNVPLWDVKSVELVSVGNARTIVANDIAAKTLNLKHRIFRMDNARHGANANIAAEYEAICYATHVLSISNFDETGDPQQIRIMTAAARTGLHADQLDSGVG
jgi:hypothetical protein